MRAPTPANPTGPAYRRGAPFRDRLDVGVSGPPLWLSGRVLWVDGAPASGATLDLWQASPRGMYGLLDRAMRLRGRIRAGEDGAWAVRTVVPGGYLWRPPHVHVKVWLGEDLLLTTQLYLPGDVRLRLDPHPRPELLLRPTPREGGLEARYDLVLAR